MNGSLQELGRLTGEVGRFCRERSLNNEAEFELNLVLEELFTNAVRHGGCEGMARAVEVRLRLLDGGAVAVDFRDRGLPFDPAEAQLPDLDAPLSERRAGGLGLHLVRQLVQDFHYERVGEWNRITMRREGN